VVVLRVGLTGGIGSGKSTVAELLAARGAVVVDADEVARFVVAPGQPALAKLVERFGSQILAPDGSLDRTALARLAFANEEATADLNAITHPAIGDEFVRRMEAAPSDAIVVCDVPLLVESDIARARGYEFVIVVEAPLEVRLERLEARGVRRADALARMAKQASDEERRAIATHIIDNSGDRAALERQVDAVWADLVHQHTDKMRGRNDESPPSPGSAPAPPSPGSAPAPPSPGGAP
jgi:dephospho-CoA kinase